MNCNPQGFLSEELLSINASSWFDFGKRYGLISASLAAQRLRVLQQEISEDIKQTLEHVPEYLASLENLAAKGIGTLGTTNWIAQYLEVLQGYAAGSGLSLHDCAKLQIVDSLACETIIVRQKNTSHTIFLHMEENFSEAGVGYPYRWVQATVGERTYHFFGYPGLCFGGPAMGINYTTNTFMAVDSLYATVSKRLTNILWTNAATSIIFMIGDSEEIRQFVKQMRDHNVSVLDGCAVQIVQVHPDEQHEIFSVEYGGDAWDSVDPDETDDRVFVAQPNYPRSLAQQEISTLKPPPDGVSWSDADSAITSYEMQRRQVRLEQWAKQIPFTFSSSADMFTYLAGVCMVSPGDTYSKHDTTPATALISDSVVSYAFGQLKGNIGDIVIGKHIPVTDLSLAPAQLAVTQKSSILPSATIETLIKQDQQKNRRES